MRQRISTSDVPQHARLDFWRDWLAGEFYPVAVDGCDSEDFRAECELNTAGDITLARFKASRMSFVRSPSQIRSFNYDQYVVVVTEQAPRLFEQNGRDIHCRDGDIFLIDAARPHSVCHDTDLSVTSLYVPRRRLDAVLGSTDASGLVLDGKSPTARLIGGYIRNLATLSNDLEDEAAKRLATIGLDLIAAGFAERVGCAGTADDQPGMTIVRARALIEEMLQDPDLDAAKIAVAMGMPRRRLYEIFRDEDLSIAELIWERRLIRAAQMLAGDPKALTPIAEIAFRTGFSSPAHFSRRFKSRFQESPAEHRAKESRRRMAPLFQPFEPVPG